MAPDPIRDYSLRGFFRWGISWANFQTPDSGTKFIYRFIEGFGVFLCVVQKESLHAFIRDEGPRYNPAAAQICYGMVVELFKRKLGEGHLPASAAAAPAEAKH